MQRGVRTGAFLYTLPSARLQWHRPTVAPLGAHGWCGRGGQSGMGPHNSVGACSLRPTPHTGARVGEAISIAAAGVVHRPHGGRCGVWELTDRRSRAQRTSLTTVGATHGPRGRCGIRRRGGWRGRAQRTDSAAGRDALTKGSTRRTFRCSNVRPSTN